MKIRNPLLFAFGVAAVLGTTPVLSQDKPAAVAVPNGWAYLPVQKPATPAVKDKRWVRTPIDAFILAKLEEKGLKPSPDADRATLVRRLYLDVHGLVPSPEEVKAFVDDRSPDAYEKLVDRLLASPHYGERQGRRWLDLARYGDSTGYGDDDYRPGQWRYRDYVIKSFNTDKPFNQFVREQIAGDELWPGRQDAIVATGFLRNYPDAADHRDLVLKRYESITNMTDTVGTVLLGHSVECGRCHNHKFDKLSQKDYFSLQAFFANTNASDSLPVIDKGERERKFERDYAAWEELTKDVRQRMDAYIAPYTEAILKYGKERFYEDGRAALFKPEDQQDSLDRWLNYRFKEYVVKNQNNYPWQISFYGQAASHFTEVRERAEAEPGVDKAVIAEAKKHEAEFRKLLRELREFNDRRPEQGATVLSGVTELGHGEAAKQFVYAVGSHERPLEEVQPAFPALFTPNDTQPKITPTATSSGRRTALADWLVSPGNPLTTRVFVNRLWASYFDNGIAATTSDFGRAGQKPTHPELLDYLASNFAQQGWSVKKATRELLLSSTYRQASAHRADAQAADPQNKLLAVFPRKRLEAEQVRDSLLAAAGLLVERDGGPGVYPPIPDAVMKQSTRRIAAFWPVSKNVDDHHTRSVYVYVRRSVPYPLLETFDGPSSQNPHSRRDVTTTPQQSLTLFNNELVYDWSKAIAGRAIREAGNNEGTQVDRLFQILFSRAPDKDERKAALAFLNQHTGVIQEQAAAGRLTVAYPIGLKQVPTNSATRLAAFVDLAHALANSNEFIYRF